MGLQEAGSETGSPQGADRERLQSTGAHRSSPGRAPGPFFPHFVKGAAIAKDGSAEAAPGSEAGPGARRPPALPRAASPLTEGPGDDTKSVPRGCQLVQTQNGCPPPALLSERLLSRPPADWTPAGTAAHRLRLL